MEFINFEGVAYSKPATKASQSDYMTTYFHEQRLREENMLRDNKEIIDLLQQINKKKPVKSTSVLSALKRFFHRLLRL